MGRSIRELVVSKKKQKEAREAMKAFIEKTSLSKEDVLLLMKLENRTEFDRLTVLCEDMPEWVFYDLHELNSDEEDDEKIWPD